MEEDFSDVSNKSLWALTKNFADIVEVLKQELPFDYLTAEWHIEDGTDNMMIGVSGRWHERYHSLTTWTHYLESPPQPKEMYPENCCAVATLEVITSAVDPRVGLEICGTPERWLVHQNDRWVPLSAYYVAFLLGMSHKPSAEETGQSGA